MKVCDVGNRSYEKGLNLTKKVPFLSERNF